MTWRELRAAGISADAIKHRARVGLLIRQYRGVYRVGHTAPSPEASYLAAVKACGEGAVLFGWAAAYHQSVVLTRNPPPPEVMAPTQRSVKGVKTRRCRSLHPLDTAEHRGIPITTVPRTLLDLAATMSGPDLARACHEAWIKHRTGPSHLKAVLGRNRTAPGRRKLERVMSGDARVTLSVLEREFLTALREDGIELPQTNIPVGGHYVDCRWPEHKLTVELDSFRFHNTRHSWEQDRRRRREARARRDAFRSYSWSDVHEDRREMLDEIRSLLRG